MRIPVVLAAGAAVIAVTVAVTLFRSPSAVIASNSIGNVGYIGTAIGGVSGVCQTDETLPRGTSQITLFLESVFGPKLVVEASRDGRVLARGTKGVGWTGGSVTIPVKRVRSTVSGVKLCVRIGTGSERVSQLGGPAPKRLTMRTSAGHPLAGRMRVEYLRAGNQTWWALLLQVARRIGLGHALAGGWVAVLLATIMLAAAGLSSWLAIRELQ